MTCYERFTWTATVAVILAALMLTGCSDSDRGSPLGPDATAVVPMKPPAEHACYIAIDIDDVFQPNWDSANNRIGDVKMDRADAEALMEMSDTINTLFPLSDFKFSLGYNSGFYEADCDGDRAFLEHAAAFSWFNHLPLHEHVESRGLSALTIYSLLCEGYLFAINNGLGPYITDYLVTPKHEGIWPPYDPLYEALTMVGITTVSTDYVECPAMYDGVDIMTRRFIGIGSGDYSFGQVSEKTVREKALLLYSYIREQQFVVVYSHQANFARDRLGALLVEELCKLLQFDAEVTYIFLPSHEVVYHCHDSL